MGRKLRKCEEGCLWHSSQDRDSAKILPMEKKYVSYFNPTVGRRAGSFCRATDAQRLRQVRHEQLRPRTCRAIARTSHTGEGLRCCFGAADARRAAKSVWRHTVEPPDVADVRRDATRRAGRRRRQNASNGSVDGRASTFAILLLCRRLGPAQAISSVRSPG